MKDSNTLINRYTETLYEISSDHQMIDKVHQELIRITQTIECLGNWQRLALNPKVPARTKIKIWQIILEVSNSSQIIDSFVMTLINGGRIHLFLKIFKNFEAILFSNNKVKTVNMTTSVKLSADHLTEITKSLENIFKQKINLNERIDPRIVGGVVFKFDSYMLDASLKSKLNYIKSTLLA